MRCIRGRDAELWVSEISDSFDMPVRLIQEYTRHGIITPKIPATGGGGRNVYGRVELVKLLIARSLAEGRMPWKEVREVIGWLEWKMVSMARYPDDPNDFVGLPDNGKFDITSWDPMSEDAGPWQKVSLDPLPSDEVAKAFYGKTRGYPEQPTNSEEWRSYWGNMAQFLDVDRCRTGLTTLEILIPHRWLNTEEGRFKGIKGWFNEVIGDLVFEPVLRDSGSPLSTVHILDLARIKKQVVDMLLSESEKDPTEETEIDEEMMRNMESMMLMAIARRHMSRGR